MSVFDDSVLCTLGAIQPQTIAITRVCTLLHFRPQRCVFNALMEQEVAVRMTNFALILNDLTASFEGRNEYIARLCRAPLLILDDFGMERGTEYGLEQVYNVIDSRYRSRRPLIGIK